MSGSTFKLPDTVLFTFKTFMPGDWEKKREKEYGSATPMIVSTITAPKDEIVIAAAWVIYNNPTLKIEFEKGQHDQHADNFVHNRVTVIFKAKLKETI